jgi:hypothetical protein
VNDAQLTYAALEMPFGGVRESGIGVRNSAHGIQKFCRTQSVIVTRFGGRRDPYWFPYSKRTTKLIDRLNVALHGRGPRRT